MRSKLSGELSLSATPVTQHVRFILDTGLFTLVQGFICLLFEVSLAPPVSAKSIPVLRLLKEQSVNLAPVLLQLKSCL